MRRKRLHDVGKGTGIVVFVSKRCCSSPISAVVSASLKPSDCEGAAAGHEEERVVRVGKDIEAVVVVSKRCCCSPVSAEGSASLKPNDYGECVKGRRQSARENHGAWRGEGHRCSSGRKALLQLPHLSGGVGKCET